MSKHISEHHKTWERVPLFHGYEVKHKTYLGSGLWSPSDIPGLEPQLERQKNRKNRTEQNRGRREEGGGERK